MTEPDRLDILDTDYAALVATGYDRDIERLIRLAEDSPTDAVILTRLVGLTQKPLQTEENWQEFEALWSELERSERGALFGA